MSDDPRSEQAIRERVEKYYKERSEFVIHVAFFAVINLALAGVALFGLISWLVPFMLTLAWGSGVIAHVIEIHGLSNRQHAAILDATEAEMRQRYGTDWDVIANEDEYHAAYEQVMKRFEGRRELAQHAIIYVLINLLIWGVVLNVTRGQGAESVVLPLLVSVFWGLGLGAHYLSVGQESGKWAAAREKAVQEAIAREQSRITPKRKHDRLQLTEDGELIDIVVEDAWQDDKPKREAQ